ncbi:uncharacterized protein [Parasteatoda tepidariorum]|uniref:uncharacterized protein n=1 Tax=Parasteatoda tepidariorum TaxID=114398 RepID=UPI0039BD6C40
MWVKRNDKNVFLNLSDYFLNLGNIEDHSLKDLVLNAKYSEVIDLIPPEKLIMDFQTAFTILDFKGKDVVHERDAKVTLRALGIEPTAKKVKKLIERVAINSDLMALTNPVLLKKEAYVTFYSARCLFTIVGVGSTSKTHTLLS